MYLQTKRYEQTMMALVAASLSEMIQTAKEIF